MNAAARAYRRKNIDRMREMSRAWRSANRARCRMLWHKRRARMKAAPGSYTPNEWNALLEWFGGVCLCCGTHDDLTIDHVVPLVKGGSNNIDNLQPLCRSCNSVKHHKTMDYRDPVRLSEFLSTL